MSLRGFPRPDNIAPFSKRYEGLFHYSAYTREWDRIVAVGNAFWTVQAVDNEGNIRGPERIHRTPLHADMFANAPFPVTMKDLETRRG